MISTLHCRHGPQTHFQPVPITTTGSICIRDFLKNTFKLEPIVRGPVRRKKGWRGPRNLSFLLTAPRFGFDPLTPFLFQPLEIFICHGHTIELIDGVLGFPPKG